MSLWLKTKELKQNTPSKNLFMYDISTDPRRNKFDTKSQTGKSQIMHF